MGGAEPGGAGRGGAEGAGLYPAAAACPVPRPRPAPPPLGSPRSSALRAPRARPAPAVAPLPARGPLALPAAGSGRAVSPPRRDRGRDPRGKAARCGVAALERSERAPGWRRAAGSAGRGPGKHPAPRPSRSLAARCAVLAAPPPPPAAPSSLPPRRRSGRGSAVRYRRSDYSGDLTNKGPIDRCGIALLIAVREAPARHRSAAPPLPPRHRSPRWRRLRDGRGLSALPRPPRPPLPPPLRSVPVRPGRVAA